MRCPTCGRQFPAGSNFCSECGTPLIEGQAGPKPPDGYNPADDASPDENETMLEALQRLLDDRDAPEAAEREDADAAEGQADAEEVTPEVTETPQEAAQQDPHEMPDGQDDAAGTRSEEEVIQDQGAADEASTEELADDEEAAHDVVAAEEPSDHTTMDKEPSGQEGGEAPADAAPEESPSDEVTDGEPSGQEDGEAPANAAPETADAEEGDGTESDRTEIQDASSEDEGLASDGEPGPDAEHDLTQELEKADGATSDEQQPDPEDLTAKSTPADPTETGEGDGDQAPDKQKSPARRRMMIAAAVILVICLGGLTAKAVIEHMNGVAYEEATQLMEEGEYSTASERFATLGDYKDSRDLAAYCDDADAFVTAQELFEAKEYQKARDIFAELGDFTNDEDLPNAEDYLTLCDGWMLYTEVNDLTEQEKYDEASEKASELSDYPSVQSSEEVRTWRQRNTYGQAGLRLGEGEFYTAYSMFTGLGDYEDAAERAKSCVQGMPESGEMYHNDGFVSSSVQLTFEAGLADEPHYVKVYSGDTHVSTVFIRVGSSTSISLPAGTYTFKKAMGDKWFGEKDLFGDEGRYAVMVFSGEDGSNQESVDLVGGGIYTITLVINLEEDEGNVGARSIGRSSV